jgi:two-component system KDP operon response regulator KdpE
MSDPASAQILVIDDEVQIRRLLRVTLEGGGFRVAEAETAALGLTEAAALRPDLVVLDLGLPDLPGVELLRRLREWSPVPVLILSVRGGEQDKIAALDAGADDYLTKPFGSGELLARARAMLRRQRGGGDPTAVVIGPITVDLAARAVRKGGQLVKLTAKEYAFLRLLVVNRGKVITHRQILREIWGPKAEAQTHYLRVYMAHLRQKLEDDPNHPKYFTTESGIGYRLSDG